MRTRFLPVILLVLCAVLAGFRAASADQTDPRLNALFGDLRSADSSDAARPIEARIWAIWLQSGSDAVDRMMALGIGQLNAGDVQSALGTFDRVVKMAPEFAEGWNKRATTLFLMGRYTDSIADIDRVLALEPRHFGALSGLGMCDSRLHRDAEALKAFHRALAVDPTMQDVAHSIDELENRLGERSI